MISFGNSVARTLIGMSALALGGMAVAQTVAEDAPPPAAGLNLPSDVQLFGKLDPNVRKATAIINKSVITGTDVDQRIGMVAALNKVEIQGDELQRLRVQVLRQLIDERLQVQEAKRRDIEVKREEIDANLARIATNFAMTRPELATFLRERGSSEASLRAQIEGEVAWRRVLSRRVEPLVNVSDEEVNAILERLKASQGAEEYNIKEIFLSSTPEQQQAVVARAQQMIDEIRKQSRPFEYFAINFSEATTRAVGGDLGWVRAAQLPDVLAANAAQMQVGQVAGPIDVGGGYSIVWMVDKRRVLSADARDARVDLRQITIDFAPGTTREQAGVAAERFTEAVRDLKGCGDVQAVANRIGAKVVTNDQNTIRDLPPQLQEILMRMQVGQATPTFGTPESGVRTLVLCGRDDPKGGELPSAERLKSGLENDRVNRVAMRMLRDLRRDAVIEYK